MLKSQISFSSKLNIGFQASKELEALRITIPRELAQLN